MSPSSKSEAIRLQYIGESPRIFAFGPMKKGAEVTFPSSTAKRLLDLVDETGLHLFKKARSSGKASSSLKDEGTSKED